MGTQSAPPPALTASKIAAQAARPETAALAVKDGTVASALLIEALTPGRFDAERARAIVGALRERAARLRAGDASGLEDDLAGQLALLSAMISFAVTKATEDSTSPAAADTWLRLALRAQGSYVKTITALAEVMKPAKRSADDDD